LLMCSPYLLLFFFVKKLSIRALTITIPFRFIQTFVLKDDLFILLKNFAKSCSFLCAVCFLVIDAVIEELNRIKLRFGLALGLGFIPFSTNAALETICGARVTRTVGCVCHVPNYSIFEVAVNTKSATFHFKIYPSKFKCGFILLNGF